PLPEDQEKELIHNATPFHRDVYALGILAWLILNSRRLSAEEIESAVEDIQQSNGWYADVLRRAVATNPSDRFANAGAFLDAFNERQPKNETAILFDERLLEPYRHQSLNLYKVYPEDESLHESDSKEIFRSDDLVVKIWNNVSSFPDKPHQGAQTLHFLERVESLQSINPSYLPAIRNFGLAPKTSSLFLVSEYVDGEGWEQFATRELDESIKLRAVGLLVEALEHLHSLDFYHGDLHPGNVKLKQTDDELQLFLLDIPDFALREQEVKNHRYSPLNIDGCSAFERDIFAVLRMAAELLEIDWDDPNSELYKGIADVIRLEQLDAHGFMSLERFKDALKALHSGAEKSEKTVIHLNHREFTSPVHILPDNGKVYASIKPNERNKAEARIRLAGVGGSLDFIFDPRAGDVTAVFRPRIKESVHYKEAEESDLQLNVVLEIVPDKYRETQGLSDFLKNYDGF